MRLLFLISFLIIQIVDAGAQTHTINGRVVNAAGQPIKYVNIGIPGKRIGTISNEDGRFTIDIPAGDNDSLVFSMVGFKSFAFSLRKANQVQSLFVELLPEEIPLPDVIVASHHLKKRKAGIRFRTPFVMTPSESYSNYDIIEHARMAEVRSATRILDANIFLVSSIEDSITLRLNFYNKVGDKPGNIHLVNSSIKRFKAEKGWLKFDLSDSSIYLGNNFYYSFEYLPEHVRNKLEKVRVFFGAKVGRGQSYIRKCSQCYWEKNKGFATAMYLTIEN